MTLRPIFPPPGTFEQHQATLTLMVRCISAEAAQLRPYADQLMRGFGYPARYKPRGLAGSLRVVLCDGQLRDTLDAGQVIDLG